MAYPWAKNRTAYRRAIAEGYRSGLESATASDLTSRNAYYEYEPQDKKIEYLVPTKKRRYTPDFILENGIIVETKGRFTSADRVKHRQIQEQHPELDIRFVFSNPHQKLAKNSPTTYAMWCDKYCFKWAAKKVPQSWIDEPAKEYLQRGDKNDSKKIRFKPFAIRKVYNPC